MPQKVSVLPDVDQFKAKGRELVALAITIVASGDERESLPRSSILALRRRAIVLLEGAISFVEIFLRFQENEQGGDGGK